MHPDYPHKLFADKRSHFELLMETLAMDAPIPRPTGVIRAGLKGSYDAPCI